MKRFSTLSILTFLILTFGAAFAQPPSTDVLLVPLPAMSEDAVSVAAEDVTRITDNDVYDNQPSFTPDGAAVLFVTADETGETDIFRYDPATGETTQVTDTPESEFSPQITPDGEHITAVRIEADGATQRLWQFDLDGQNAEVVLEDVARIGYYAFANPDTLALVRVDEETNGLPLSLDVANLTTGETQQIAADVGVGVVKVPGRDAVSFVKRVDGTSVIQLYDATSGETSDLTVTLPEVDAHAWLSDGTLLAAQDDTLYSWQEGQEDWQPYLEFTEAGVSGVGRLAVSPDASQLAFVISKETE